ncbi:transcriptional regulator [Yersinia kristensenii]|nr:transcriptional regulator [Yersinia kristensenii]
MSESIFWMLIELSPFRSEKVICALRDFLVLGYTRKEVCEKYSVSYSYFSISLRRFLHVDDVTRHLINYYSFAVD